MFKSLLIWGWFPTLITALAVAGLIYQWPIEATIPALIIILCIGLILVAINAKRNELELLAMRLKQLAEYFNRRFMGSSSVSIFVLIENLYSIDNPKLWDWARACSMSQRVIDTWGDNFSSRADGDFKGRKSSSYLYTYLNELWSLNNHYYEFIEQFYEVAGSFEIPPDIADQYNRFAVEYNAFVQNFRDAITELKGSARTEIEPPSVKFAQELAGVR